jgi:single-stranded DNA-specific DHH superfamily exonuclease
MLGAAGLTLKVEHCEPLTGALKAATRPSCDAALYAAIERRIWGQGFPPPLFANEFAVAKQRLLKEQYLSLTLELQGHPDRLEMRGPTGFLHNSHPSHPRPPWKPSA